MKITRDEETVKHLISNLEKEYGKTRTGIHISDLTLCLREAYFRKVEIMKKKNDPNLTYDNAVNILLDEYYMVRPRKVDG